MSAKKQQTFAKLTRERKVKEKRELKLEKKRAAREAKLAGETVSPLGDEAIADEEQPIGDEQPIVDERA